MARKTLGILELENKPLSHPGNLAGPDTFSFPVLRLTVPGASTKRIITGDLSLRDAYIRCARQLERGGVAAITTNCGFSALFQAEVAAAVSVPVALSSLILVPLVANTLPAGKKVGVVTYDSTKLREEHFVAAGWTSDGCAVAIVGIEGSETWKQLAELDPAVPPSMLIKDVTAAVRSLLRSDPSVAAIVLECAAFPIASDAVRLATGLPVADYVTLAKMIFEISPTPTEKSFERPSHSTTPAG